MNDPIASASDAHGTATALAGIPAMRRAVLMDVFATMDAGDLDGMVKHMTDDVITQFGNHAEMKARPRFAHCSTRSARRSLDCVTTYWTSGMPSRTSTCGWCSSAFPTDSWTDVP